MLAISHTGMEMNVGGSSRQRSRVYFPMSHGVRSGYTDDAVLRRGLAQSARSFLQKPFTGEQLADTISALIRTEPNSAQPA